MRVFFPRSVPRERTSVSALEVAEPEVAKLEASVERSRRIFLSSLKAPELRDSPRSRTTALRESDFNELADVQDGREFILLGDETQESELVVPKVCLGRLALLLCHCERRIRDVLDV